MTLTEGSWAGGDAVLVGGGPSLRSFDWSLLTRHPRVIAVNRAVLDCPTAAVFFTEDERVVRKYAKELNAFRGWKVAHTDESYRDACLEAVPDLTVLCRTRHDKYWSETFADGLSYSSNSMVGAINMADILGADPIHLLGVDCRIEQRIVTNYHGDYPDHWKVNSDQLRSFKSDFELWVAPHVRHRRVVNLNPDSAVECWPKARWQDVLGGGGNGVPIPGGLLRDSGAIR